MAENDIEKMYTPAEVAQLLGCTRQSVYNWIRQGRIHNTIKTGRSRRIPDKEVQRIISEGISPHS